MWFTLLAQSRSNHDTIFDTINSIFGRLDTLAHPQYLVRMLQEISIVWAVVFLIAGLVALFNGSKLYKWVTIALAMTIGICAGYAMGKRINAEFIVAGCLGLLLGVGAWPLLKYAVAAMGGLVGAFLGANLWGAAAGVADPSNARTIAETYWVGALMGLIILGMLAFIVFKLTVTFFTCVSGATIAMIGLLALLLQVPPWRQSIDSWSGRANSMVFPLLVIVPAVIGLILQQFKTSGDPAGGGGGSAKPAKA